MTYDEAVAREAVRATVSVYNRCVDEDRRDALAEAFAEDAVMEIDGRPALQGRVNIVATLQAGADRRRRPGSEVFQRHHMTSAMIEIIDADFARAVHYFLVITELGLDHAGTYRDEFRRVGDDWLIVRRAARVDWMRPNSRFAA